MPARTNKLTAQQSNVGVNRFKGGRGATAHTGSCRRQASIFYIFLTRNGRQALRRLLLLLLLSDLRKPLRLS